MDRVDEFKTVLGEMVETFARKNTDYGGAVFAHGPIGVLINIHNKLQRITTINKNSITMVVDEKLRDSLMDNAIYSIIAVMSIDEAQREEMEGLEFEIVFEEDEDVDEEAQAEMERERRNEEIKKKINEFFGTLFGDEE